MPIIYLLDFYAEMRLLRELRCKIMSYLHLPDQNVSDKDQKALKKIKIKLETIKKQDGKYWLKTDCKNEIALELDYELGELNKDEIFLEKGEQHFFNYLDERHPGFKSELAKCVHFLNNQRYQHFITDRDGTVSDYCGRYQSSIQSIHNAVFLSSFAKVIQGKSIIITSAPLYNIGLKDISIFRGNEFVLSGSKGREIIDENGHKAQYPIEKTQQRKLNRLNQALEQLLDQEEYSPFRFIGSGLQYKFGQTTLARQDKNKAIAEEKSQQLKREVEKLLVKLDPKQNFFRLEDTGKDLEIMLTVNSQDTSELKEDFNKGHGLKFITEQCNLNIKNQNLLICGDTSSDLSMLEMANKMKANCTSIFVTTNDKLKQEVKKLCNQSLIVSSPEVLTSALYLYSKTQ